MFVSLFAVATLGISGCLLSREAPTKYFLIDYVGDQSEERETESLYPLPVVVEDPRVATLYDRRQIVQRPEAPEVFLLNRDLWAVSPADAVRTAIYDQTRYSGLFPEVRRGARIGGESYRIRTHVETLEYLCCEGSPKALFEIEIILVDSADSPIARYDLASTDDISESVTEFVLTVNRRLTEAIDRFLEEVRAGAP